MSRLPPASEGWGEFEGERLKGRIKPGAAFASAFGASPAWYVRWWKRARAMLHAWAA